MDKMDRMDVMDDMDTMDSPFRPYSSIHYSLLSRQSSAIHINKRRFEAEHESGS